MRDPGELGPSLDDLDYFELLGLEPREHPAEVVRAAFHTFARDYHPDMHPPAMRALVTRIFQRGSEAYRVLLDPLLCQRYLRQLSQGRKRLATDTSLRPPPVSQRPLGFADVVRSPSALPFAMRADELIAAGKISEAKLQAQLARSKDPTNTDLEELLVRLAKQSRKP